MKRTRRIVGSVALVGALTGAGLAMAPAASAKITSENTSCENNGGQFPPGQQPTCSGGGLNQNTENVNPNGFAPPGQNK